MNDTISSAPTIHAADDPVEDFSSLGPWYQNLHLPDGTQTAPDHPLGDFPNNRWNRIRDFLPDDLSGCTVLDIGCNAGFFAIELAKRGAAVTAVDRDPHVLKQAQWAIARHGLQHKINLYQGRAYDLARWTECHDVVLFLDLFDRVRYPLLALDIAARLVKRCLVFHSLSMLGHEIEITPDDLAFEARDAFARPGWPKMAFIEKSFAGEARSWWAPNRACAEAMLRSAGLEVVAHPDDDICLCQPRSASALDHCRSEDELSSATGLATEGLRPFDAYAASAGSEVEMPAAASIEPAA